MAIPKRTSIKAESANSDSLQQIVNEGIARVIEATGIDIQKNRYKAMRAIAWQAFVNAIEARTFDQLVKAAIVNVEQLPRGWEIAAPARTAQVKPPVNKATTTAEDATR